MGEEKAMAIAPSVAAYLEERHIAYETIAHPASNCSRETAMSAHVPDDHLAKAVLLRNGESYLLVVIPANDWVDLDRVRDEMATDYHLASESEIESLFVDCKPGAVPPVGQPYGLETLLDISLTSLALVYFEAGDHERLIRLPNTQFMEMLRGCRQGHFSSSH